MNGERLVLSGFRFPAACRARDHCPFRLAGIVLSLLVVAACVPTASTIRMESPYLAKLEPELRDLEDSETVSRVTYWQERPSGKMRGALFVTSLKRAGYSFHLHESHELKNRLSWMREKNFVPDGTDGATEVFRNTLGDGQFVRFTTRDGKYCLYSLQFWRKPGNYEYPEQVLGTARVETWYCRAEPLTPEESGRFLSGIKI